MIDVPAARQSPSPACGRGRGPREAWEGEGCGRTIESTHEALPFFFSIAIFLLALSGLGVSLFPYAIPWQITLWQAAASTPTLEFAGIGVLIILPITLAYLAYAHWIFRGKVGTEGGYGGSLE